MDTGEIAATLLAALDEARLVAPITRTHPGFTLAAADDVACEIVRRRIARGERPVGRKIGFTNRNIWPQYGVYAPIWAHVYDTTVRDIEPRGAIVEVARFAAPLIEPEIVLGLKRAPEALDEDSIARALEWVAHGFEIVDCHFPGWKFEAADTVADFGLHGALLVGPRVSAERIPDLPRALREFRIASARDGEPQREGRGANALGSPLLAAAHLARSIEGRPQFRPLAGGEMITTGTLTDALPIRAGETWTTRIEGIALAGLAVKFA